MSETDRERCVALVAVLYPGIPRDALLAVRESDTHPRWNLERGEKAVIARIDGQPDRVLAHGTSWFRLVHDLAESVKRSATARSCL